MEIIQMRFETSAAKPSQFINNGMPQIVITGKSNVGKSSLINSIGNNGKLARTSATPGKTRLINYFIADNSFYIVDLPGYGFAKAPKTEQAQWQSLMDSFFQSGTSKNALMLVDIRHEPTAEDKLMRDYLAYYDFNITVVATKADKIAKSKINNYINIIRKSLELPKDVSIIAFSSQTAHNRDLLVQTIRNIAQNELISTDI